MICTKKRTNSEWLLALTGATGPEEQNQAFNDLANYLFIVLFNTLRNRRNSVSGLQHLADSELTTLAEDFVQQTMVKMSQSNFALLDKYGGHGRFLCWVAQVATNLCSSELRRKPWHQTEPLDICHEKIAHSGNVPETVMIRNIFRETLEHCLSKLPERHRFALVQCVVEDKNAGEVGDALGISANAVHILVHRAKKMMRGYLEREGVNFDVLFAELSI